MTLNRDGLGETRTADHRSVIAASHSRGWSHWGQSVTVPHVEDGGGGAQAAGQDTSNPARPDDEKPSPSVDPETVIEDAQRAHRVLR